MRRAVILPSAVGAAILGAALLVNGVLPGIALLAAAGALLLVPPPRRRGPADRSSVRLALRLARLGQRTLLVECGGRMQVARMAEAAQGPRLQYVAALAGGALILARQKP